MSKEENKQLMQEENKWAMAYDEMLNFISD